jgi:hypothetical protein
MVFDTLLMIHKIILNLSALLLPLLALLVTTAQLNCKAKRGLKQNNFFIIILLATNNSL